MKITVVGAGYVGLVTAACLAELGNHVVGVDRDYGRITLLQAGSMPIHEPGLDDMVARNIAAGRLAFSTSLPRSVNDAEVIFIAVGTPPVEDGSADMQQVLDAAREIGMHMHGYKVVINKSTVPVGAAAMVERTIRAQLERQGRPGQAFAVVSNPEFLKEGAAIEDFMRPDRIVIGIPDTPEGDKAKVLLKRLYAPFNRHHDRTLWMDVASAELTKYAANAMLAVRVSFMNEMAGLADQFDADIDAVRRGIGADARIGHGFLYAGTGYGGSCFPKDTRALIHTAAQQGLRMQIVEATERVNRAQKTLLVRRVVDCFGESLSGFRFAIWGLAFKPNTDDMREAPSRAVIVDLLARGAEIAVYDPVAMEEARRALNADLGCTPEAITRVRFADDPLDALGGADALLVITEWKCFQNPDFQAMTHRMRRLVVFDGRNIYDPEQMQEYGITYCGVGRRNALANALVAVKRAGAPMPEPSTTSINRSAIAESEV
ncbi:MAG: UDP-glucose/GDP-mannose dehydrogenase family protein [Burkholderiales bacterium]